MKELLNIYTDPIYSFPLVTILFFVWITKFTKQTATLKVGWALMIGTVLLFAWCLSDPVFNQNFFMTNDNIPIIMIVLLVVWTTWYALYKGIKNDERIEQGLEPIEGTPENREKVWAWPNLVYTELFCIILSTVFLIVWAIFFKSPLEEPADPTWAPNPAKAPWYFLGLQEMLVYFDPWIAGVLLPVLIIVGLIAIPYIDVNPKGNGYYCFKERKFAITTWLFGWLVLWIFLILIGTIFRGPNWVFYGPFEVWDAHKVLAEFNVNLSEFLWIKGLNVALPKNIFLREIAGIIAVVAYFGVGIWGLTKWKGKKMLSEMGAARYYLMVFLIFMMGSLPIKMILRWLFNLKYIVFMPEFEFNI